MDIRYFLSRQNLVRTVILLVAITLIVGGILFVRGQDESGSASDELPAFFASETNTPAPSVKWFVAPGGNDSNTGENAGQPLATIQKALEKAMPGDAISVADGTYAQSFRTVRDGTQDARITITGTRKAVVVGSDTRIAEINHDFIRLTGFTINGKHDEGTKAEDFRDKLIYAIGTKPSDGVEGLKIDNMLLENAGGECVRLRYFARHNEISRTTVKNCGIYDFRFHEGGKNGEGIYIGTAPEQLADGKNPTDVPDESRENWIHHNLIETNGNECVDIKEGAHNNLVENNKCTKQLDEESGGMDSRGDNNTFRYNEIYGNRGAGVRLGGDSDTDGINNHVYGNTIKNNGENGIKILRGPQGKICGNTFATNAGGPVGGEFGEGLQLISTCPD